jgi:hypothetical protein
VDKWQNKFAVFVQTYVKHAVMSALNMKTSIVKNAQRLVINAQKSAVLWLCNKSSTGNQNAFRVLKQAVSNIVIFPPWLNLPHQA